MTNLTSTAPSQQPQQQLIAHSDDNKSQSAAFAHQYMHSEDTARPEPTRLTSSSPLNMQGPSTRTVFQALTTAPFQESFIADEANKFLNTLFQAAGSISRKDQSVYPNSHPFSEHFFDGNYDAETLKERCSTLCTQAVSALEAHLSNCEKLDFFSEGGKFKTYLLEKCEDPKSITPLLKETASYCRLLVENLESGTSTHEQVNEVLAIFPPTDDDDYQCVNGSRARLVEALQFYNRNRLDTASLPAYLTQEISNALQDYVNTAVVKYQLKNYVSESYEVHLRPMLTSYLIGSKAIRERDGYALTPREYIPAQILYRIINEAPNALQQRTTQLNASITQGATELLANIEQCNDFNAQSAGLQMQSIREHTLNELIKQYRPFDPTGEEFIELDEDGMPIQWKIEALEEALTSTLSTHVLNTAMRDHLHHQPPHYSELFASRQMTDVAIKLAQYANRTEKNSNALNSDNRAISSILVPMHVMSTSRVGGSILYTLLITHAIGELVKSEATLEPLSNNEDSLTLGLTTLQSLANNDQLSTLDRDRLSDIVLMINKTVRSSSGTDAHHHTEQPLNIHQILSYLKQPSTYFPKTRSLFGSSHKQKNQQLAAELIKGNAPISLWRDLFSEPTFLRTLSRGSIATYRAQPHPEVDQLILLFNEKCPKFLADYLSKPLSILIQQNDMDTIKRITDLNIPSEILLGNHHNSGNLNTVQQAAIHNRPEVIKRLHKMGISVDQLLMFNKTSSQSYSAVELSVTSNHPDIIKAFSDIGATPKQLDPAAASSILSGPPSRTTTLLAVKNNYTEVLQALIDAGLTENQLLRANNNNERPHYIAAEKGFADALMIVGKALPPKKLFGTKEPHYSDSLLKTAVLGGRHGEGNNQDLINVLCKLDKERAWINKPCAYDNATALILSITKHKNKAMSALIDHLTIDELLTPCQQGRLPLHYAIEAEKYATRPAIKALVDKGIAINDLITVDKYGQSPLHIAVQRDRSNTISFMRSLGMDASALSVTTRIQWSPIHLAARNNSLSALKKLVDCGASKKQLNLAALGLDGGTPLEIAQRHKHTKIVKYLTQILSNENENA